MSENKYESRVRERAEEMAKASFPRSKYNSYGDRYTDKENASYWARTIKKLLPAARLSVQREAEAYGDALRYAGWSNYRIKGKLQSLGLVPENEPDQEAGKV